jgi:8-oxo-dGTP diphosphatase
MNEHIGVRTVVIVLPCKEGAVLMQLRDIDKDISYSGHWGYFGGHIEPNEGALTCARREVFEEVGLSVENLHHLQTGFACDINTFCYSYGCELTVPLSVLRQTEGVDMKLVTREELMSGMVYSEKLGRAFPVVPSPFVIEMFNRATAN